MFFLAKDNSNFKNNIMGAKGGTLWYEMLNQLQSKLELTDAVLVSQVENLVKDYP